MGRWKIYDSSGSVRRESKTGFNNDGDEVVVETLAYSGTWMGESFLTVTVKSAYPVDFQIGDYIDYRGERFSINYDPSVIKKSRRGTYGEGFTYDSIKFNACSDELTRCDFQDYVLDDNEVHYSSLPVFAFYAETVDDLADRIQANLNRLYTESGGRLWHVITPSEERTARRGELSGGEGTMSDFQDIHSQYSFSSVPGGNTGVSVSASDMSCWDALALVNTSFGLNFIIKGRDIIIGSDGVALPHKFLYGKGNGLYEMERDADSGQAIVTRVHAYGTDKNMPLRYYASIGGELYTVGDKFSTKELSSGADLFVIRTTADYPSDPGSVFLTPWSSPSGTEWYFEYGGENVAISGYLVTAKYGGYRCRSLVMSVGGKLSVVLGWDGSEPYGSLQGKAAVVYAAADAGETFRLCDGTVNDSALPDNMSLNVLMLPGFPNKSLSQWAEDNSYAGSGVGFSDKQYEPYVDSDNVTAFGVREKSIHFNEEDDSNGLEEVYPTIKEMTAGDAGLDSSLYDSSERLDEVSSATQVTDDGAFDEGSTVSDIYITLKYMGFDLKQAFADTGSMTISMTDGMCGGRDFEVKSVSEGTETVNGNERKTWVCRVGRVEDSTLNLWFPYSDYNIQAGDHFVITGISLPDVYVEAASRKLLRKTIAWLKDNDHSAYTYTLRIDEIFMARQHDEAVASGGVSLHDTIREGMLMQFGDDDIDGLPDSVTIDQLAINENGNNGLPTYEVTLRDETEPGTIQKVQNKVDSIEQKLESGGYSQGGTAGGNASQTRNLVELYGSELFLSKTGADTASGLITFLKGMALGDGTYGIDETGAARLLSLLVNGKWGTDSSGNATFNSVTVSDAVKALSLLINGKWGIDEDGTGTLANLGVSGKVTTKDLVVTGAAHFFKLVIDAIRNAGGAWLVTPASGFTADIVTSTATDVYRIMWRSSDADGKQIANEWQAGFRAVCKPFNAATGESYDVSTRFWWGTVTAAGRAEWTDGNMYNYIDVSLADGDKSDDTNTVPQAGDEIAMLGTTADYAASDSNAQGALYIASYQSIDTGIKPPFIAIYDGITDFDLASHRIIWLSPADGLQCGAGKLHIFSGSSSLPVTVYKGTWKAQAYNYYEQVTYNGSLYTCSSSSGCTASDVPGVSSKWSLSVGKGEDGASLSIKGNAIGHYTDVGDIPLNTDGVFLCDTSSDGIPDTYVITVSGTERTDVLAGTGDSYFTTSDGHLWTVVEGQTVWVDCGEIKGSKGDKGDKGDDGADGTDGTDGKDGAVLFITPQQMSFETDSNGQVPEESGQTATVSVKRAGTAVAISQISLGSPVNCAVSSSGDAASGFTVTLTPDNDAEISYTDADGNTATKNVARTSGYVDVTVKLSDTGETLAGRLSFSVSVQALWHETLENDAKFTRQYTSLETVVNGEDGESGLVKSVSELTQTSKEIEASVNDTSAKLSSGEFVIKGGTTKFENSGGDVVATVNEDGTISGKLIKFEELASKNGDFSVDKWGNVLTGVDTIGSDEELGDSIFIVENKSNIIVRKSCKIILPNDSEYIGRRLVLMTEAVADNTGNVGDIDAFPAMRIATGRACVNRIYAYDKSGSGDYRVMYLPSEAGNNASVYSPWTGVRYLSGLPVMNGYYPEEVSVRNGYIELLGVGVDVNNLYEPSGTDKLNCIGYDMQDESDLSSYSLSLERDSADGTIIQANANKGMISQTGGVSGTASGWSTVDKICRWIVVNVRAEEIIEYQTYGAESGTKI